ncbi:MAG: DUF2207 domain-containing protein [Oryzihumus sp.]
MGARGRLRALLGVLVALGVLLGLPTAALAADGEHIVSFTAAYDVQADGGMDVTETLVWDFGGGEHHGIKRYVITQQGYQNSTTQHRVYEMSDVSASSPSGAPADVDVSQLGANTVIRVGDPNQTVEGTQTYVIRYHLAHVVNGFPDHVELFWNVTGDQTSIPTDKVSVTVHGPAAVTKAACYYGAQGSKTQCAAQPGATATFSAGPIPAYQQVSVVSSFPTTAFTNTSPDLRSGGTDTSGSFAEGGSTLSPAAASAVSLLGVGAGVTVPVLAAALMGFLVWTRGRDEQYAGLTPGLTPADGAEGQVVRGSRPGAVAVQFQPPQGVQPGMVGTIIDETANTIDVSATVVDLAVRGFLTVREVPGEGMFSRTDWELTALPPPAGEELLTYEQVLLNGIFRESNPVMLSALKNQFAPTLSSVQSDMYAEVVRRGWFRKSPQSQRRVWTGLGMALVIVGVGSGWFFGLNSSAVDARAGLGLPIPSGIILAAGLVIAGLIVNLLGRRMAARTASGSAVLAQSLGFKQYLLTAEANQIAFDEAANIFSRYLPFAIVFGVADRWAKVFADVAQAAAAAGQTMVMPSWYVFGPGGFGGFQDIAHGVDSFSTTASGTFTSTPGSSGSSGFGGGGFSGGGGGGGGSGSW